MDYDKIIERKEWIADNWELPTSTILETLGISRTTLSKIAKELGLPRHHRREDLTGQRYGRLVALRFSHRLGKATYWRFRCDCGNEIFCNVASVKSGLTRSCGCLRNEVIARCNEQRRLKADELRKQINEKYGE